MRPLIIGQAPGPKTLPERPLFPWPRSSAGYRLMTFGGLTRSQFIREFDKINLINQFPGKLEGGKGDRFPVSEAREAAEKLREELTGRRVLFLGRKVAAAFGYSSTPFFSWYHDRFDFSVLPHPSGCSTAYNDQMMRGFLSEVMQRALDPAPIN